MRNNEEQMNQSRSYALAKLRAGLLDAAKMKAILEAAKFLDLTASIIAKIKQGIPVQITAENVDHYNSLQVSQCDRFIVDPAGEFSVARTLIAEQGWLARRD